MSNLHILNRATPNRCGNGIPFYNKLFYIFARSNDDIYGGSSVCDNGFWLTPQNKLPTFQIEHSNGVNTQLRVVPTKNGWVDLSGTPIIAGFTLTAIPVTKNGVGSFFYQCVNQTLAMPQGRWIVELTFENGTILYSEEFLNKSCITT